jgi:hypothetical protein
MARHSPRRIPYHDYPLNDIIARAKAMRRGTPQTPQGADCAARGLGAAADPPHAKPGTRGGGSSTASRCPKTESVTFRNHDIGKRGGVERPAGQMRSALAHRRLAAQERRMSSAGDSYSTCAMPGRREDPGTPPCRVWPRPLLGKDRPNVPGTGVADASAAPCHPQALAARRKPSAALNTAAPSAFVFSDER